jgi:hypothetical protein
MAELAPAAGVTGEVAGFELDAGLRGKPRLAAVLAVALGLMAWTRLRRG